MINGLSTSPISPFSAQLTTPVTAISPAPALLKAGDLLSDPRNARIDQSKTLAAPEDNAELKEAFDDFVGQTFYSLMLQQLRETVGEPAYFHGGRAEEVFEGQLDQIIAEELSDASGGSMSGSMFELFQLRRQ